MKLLGFYNLNKTVHRTVPIKNVLHAKIHEFTPEVTRYFIRIKGVTKAIEVSREDYVNALAAMEYS